MYFKYLHICIIHVHIPTVVLGSSVSKSYSGIILDSRASRGWYWNSNNDRVHLRRWRNDDLLQIFHCSNCTHRMNLSVSLYRSYHEVHRNGKCQRIDVEKMWDSMIGNWIELILNMIRFMHLIDIDIKWITFHQSSSWMFFLKISLSAEPFRMKWLENPAIDIST